MISEQTKHYGDIAVIGGVGGLSSLSFWLELAKNGTVFLTCLGALLAAIWSAWRILDRWRYGPAQKRGGDDGDE